MVYKFFDKKSDGSGVATTKPKYQLANELHKQIIRNFKRRKVYSSFRDDISGVYLDANTKKESSIYCVQLICLVNMHELFL